MAIAGRLSFSSVAAFGRPVFAVKILIASFLAGWSGGLFVIKQTFLSSFQVGQGGSDVQGVLAGFFQVPLEGLAVISEISA